MLWVYQCTDLIPFFKDSRNFIPFQDMIHLSICKLHLMFISIGTVAFVWLVTHRNRQTYIMVISINGKAPLGKYPHSYFGP